MPSTFEKHCPSKRAFLNELYVYQSDFPFKPDLIELKKPNTLVLSKIDGIPYLNFTPCIDIIVKKLAQVISSFHAITHLDDKVLCHWDNQPRNIMWDAKTQKFRLIDFEDIRLASPEADLTHLFLFWAEVMCHDIFTSCVNTFLTSYKPVIALDSVRWKKQLRNSKARFDQRRQKYNKKEPVSNPDRLINRKYLSDLSKFN